MLASLSLTAPSHAAEPRPLRESPHFRFHGEQRLRPVIDKLAAEAETRFARLCKRIDACKALDVPITVWVSEDAESFAKAFPDASPLSEWAVGVAFPAQSRIVLRAYGTAYFTLMETFEHEISHVLLHHLVDGRHVPRWFNEGLAIWQAGERVIDRLATAQAAALGSSLLSFESLDRSFPSRGPSVALAYAQSALFIRFIERRGGPRVIPSLCRDLAAGLPFDSAVERQLGDTVETLEELWQDELTRNETALVLFRDGTLIWLFMALLFVWVALRKMRERREALAAMGDYEDLEEAYAELKQASEDEDFPTLH